MTDTTQSSPAFDRPPRLTIVIASCRNTSYAQRRSLDAVRSQTIPDAELILVDRNAYADPYSLSLQEDTASMPDVQVIPCQGMTEGAGRNAALKAAKGTYIAFTDGEELWRPEKAQKQVAQLEKSPEAAASCCKGTRIGIGGTRVFTRVPSDDEEDVLFSDFYESSSCAVYRRDLLETLGGFDESLKISCDRDMLLRLKALGEILILDEELYSRSDKPIGKPEERYYACRYLYDKYLERSLRDRKLSFRFHTAMMQLAAASTLWVQMLIHMLLAFGKRPLYSLMHAASAVWWAVGYVFRNQVLRGLLSFHTQDCRRKVARLHDENAWKNVRVWPTTHTVIPPEQRIHSGSEPMQYAYQRRMQNVVLTCSSSAIHEGQFARCTALVRVVIPAYVRSIDAHAFQGCYNLESVEFQEGSVLERISAFAFAGCNALTRIVLPASVSRIDEYAFAQCLNLESILFGYFENGSYVPKEEFPVAVTHIRQGTFAGCSSLKKVALPGKNMILRIDQDAFAGCGKLETFLANNAIRSLGAYAFAHCVSLTNVVLPKGDAMESIGRGAFLQCRALPYFKIPTALVNIPKYCFYGCCGFQTVRIPRNVLLVDQYAFGKCENLICADIVRRSTKVIPYAFDPTVSVEYIEEPEGTGKN